MDEVLNELKAEAKISPKMNICNTPYLCRERNYSEITTKGDSSLRIFKEVAHVVGKIKVFRRVFCRQVAGAEVYSMVGWVLDCDIDHCMICGKGFFLFDKHHCRVCGNLVCDPCSAERVNLSEFPEWGPQRVCKMCHFGQDAVSVMPFKKVKQQQLISALQGDENRNSLLVTKLDNPEYVKPKLSADGSQHVTVDLQGGSRKPTTAELQFLASVNTFHDAGNDKIADIMGLYVHCSDDDSDESDNMIMVKETKESVTVNTDRMYTSADSADQWQRRRQTSDQTVEDEEVEDTVQFARLTYGALQALQEQLLDNDEGDECSDEDDYSGISDGEGINVVTPLRQVGEANHCVLRQEEDDPVRKHNQFHEEEQEQHDGS